MAMSNLESLGGKMKDYNCANCGVSVFTDTYEFECPECSYVNDSVDHIDRLEECIDTSKSEQINYPIVADMHLKYKERVTLVSYQEYSELSRELDIFKKENRINGKRAVDHIYRLEEIQDNFKNEQRRADHLYDETQNLADRLRTRDDECARLCRLLDDVGIDYQIEGEA